MLTLAKSYILIQNFAYLIGTPHRCGLTFNYWLTGITAPWYFSRMKS